MRSARARVEGPDEGERRYPETRLSSRGFQIFAFRRRIVVSGKRDSSLVESGERRMDFVPSTFVLCTTRLLCKENITDDPGANISRSRRRRLSSASSSTNTVFPGCERAEGTRRRVPRIRRLVVVGGHGGESREKRRFGGDDARGDARGCRQTT